MAFRFGLSMMMLAVAACSGSSPAMPEGERDGGSDGGSDAGPDVAAVATCEDSCPEPDRSGAEADERQYARETAQACQQDCVATVSGLPEACAECLADEFAWEGGCNERECTFWVQTPELDSCADACAQSLELGERCWRAEQCPDGGECYGARDAEGDPEPPVCQAECIAVGDETVACRANADCCEGVCDHNDTCVVPSG